MVDLVNHPPHYTSHPSGVECITVTEHMNFCLGNAMKYIWRASEKGNTIEDLKKARWYLDREIARLELAAFISTGEPQTQEGDIVTDPAKSECWVRSPSVRRNKKLSGEEPLVFRRTSKAPRRMGPRRKR